MKQRPALYTLLAVVVVDLIGFGVVVPILPFYAESYGASATVLGLLLTSYALMQLIFAPLWGRLSDRIGRRPVILMTIAGTAIALFMLGLADSLVGLFAARIFGGIFSANISVAGAFIGDVTAEDERTRWMGMIGAAFGVGFLLGPGTTDMKIRNMPSRFSSSKVASRSKMAFGSVSGRWPCRPFRNQVTIAI